MPDRELTGFSRVCPSCGRRVPRNVATCRCGAALPVEPAGRRTTRRLRRSRSRRRRVTAGRARCRRGYWTSSSCPAPATRSPARTVANPHAPAGQRLRPAAEVSPEARAWDAARASRDAAASSARPPAPAPPRSAARHRRLSASLEEMVDRVMPAVVLIETTSGRGSGFYVRDDTLITNVHVVAERRLRDAAAHRRHDRHRPRRTARAGFRHRDAQGGDSRRHRRR